MDSSILNIYANFDSYQLHPRMFTCMPVDRDAKNSKLGRGCAQKHNGVLEPSRTIKTFTSRQECWTVQERWRSNSIACLPTISHLVKTPARVMTLTTPPQPARLDHITIRQPDPNKQQLPQLTDKESGTIAHGRGHPIKQPGVTVGGLIRLLLLEPSSAPSFLHCCGFVRLLPLVGRGGSQRRVGGLEVRERNGPPPRLEVATFPV